MADFGPSRIGTLDGRDALLLGLIKYIHIKEDETRARQRRQNMQQFSLLEDMAASILSWLKDMSPINPTGLRLADRLLLCILRAKAAFRGS